MAESFVKGEGGVWASALLEVEGTNGTRPGSESYSAASDLPLDIVVPSCQMLNLITYATNLPCVVVACMATLITALRSFVTTIV
jgi:hypothetical protein